MEDVLEELVGEIVSELSQVADPFHRLPDGSTVVRGDTPVREVNRVLEMALPEGDDWSTIGGLCMALAGRVPRAGDAFTVKDGTRIEVRSATERSVGDVRVLPPVE
jgi:putative hemolysin